MSNNKLLNNKRLEIKKIDNKIHTKLSEDESNKVEDMTLTIKILIVCCAFIFYGKIIYYLYNIDSSCHCIRDWRICYDNVLYCAFIIISAIYWY